MAFDEYLIVRKSNLYEYKGLAKPLLMQIAWLIIGPPKEGQEADPDQGWCVAKQDTLAAMLGCSESQVNRHVDKFERHGWLTVDRRIDERTGKMHCRYSFTKKQLDRITAREMKKQGTKFVRAKNENKRRGDKSLKNLLRESPWNRPSDTVSEATVQIPTPTDTVSEDPPTPSQWTVSTVSEAPTDTVSVPAVAFQGLSQAVESADACGFQAKSFTPQDQSESNSKDNVNTAQAETACASATATLEVPPAYPCVQLCSRCKHRKFTSTSPLDDWCERCDPEKDSYQ